MGFGSSGTHQSFGNIFGVLPCSSPWCNPIPSPEDWDLFPALLPSIQIFLSVFLPQGTPQAGLGWTLVDLEDLDPPGIPHWDFSLFFQRVWQWELDSGPLENPPLPRSRVPGKTQS